MERLTSAKNPVVKGLRALRDHRGREAAGRILVEGEVMLREAVSCGLRPFDLLAVERYAPLAAQLEEKGARAFLVPESLLDSVCDTRTPQGICASFGMPEPLSVGELPDLVVALDGVQDPGNVGTIWRTADAAGFGAILFGDGSADPMSPKVLRAAMGSGFRLPFAFASPLSSLLRTLSAAGYRVIASDLTGDDFYARPDPGRKLVLLIGNEARGISEDVRACADLRLRLPMRGGAESLNAAVAAGILMYDLMKEYHT